MGEASQRLTALIVDDEAPAREVLSILLKEFFPEVELLGLCSDLPAAVKAIRKQQPQVVFLDIGMPGYSGLELLDFFEPEEVRFQIIFVTAYKEYALEAFRLAAVDYLLKPLQVNQLREALTKVMLQHFSSGQMETLRHNLTQERAAIYVPTQEAEYRLLIEDLIYIEAAGAYCTLHRKQGPPILTAKHLKYFEQLLKEYPQMLRVHRSFMVNREQVLEKRKGPKPKLLLQNGEEIPYNPQRWV